MNVVFADEALAELEDAVDYYESKEAGLGLEFADEVARALERVVAYPAAWSTCSRRARRCMVNRFPYGLIYQVATTDVRILAVAHASRKPGYWKVRGGVMS